MLILTRKPGQTIIETRPDGSQVEFTVVEIRGDRVRLGIVAPLDTRVDREEVAEARARAAKEQETVTT